MSWPSTLETKWNSSCGCAKPASAGDRHLRPEVAAADADVDDVAELAAPRRRAPAPSRRRRASRRAPRGTSSLNGAAPGGARKAVCSTARPSVTLIASPASIASRCASTPHSRARSARKCSVAASTRFFDRSAEDLGRLEAEALEARRIARERVAQVEVAAVRLEVAAQGGPGGGRVAAREEASSACGRLVRGGLRIVGRHDRHAVPGEAKTRELAGLQGLATPPRRRRRSA